MNLQAPPGSSALVRAAVDLVLVAHISGGTVGIISGFATLWLRKGARWHRLIGNVFVVSMLTMSAIGAIVSPMLPQRVNVVPGLFTFYLVTTAWATARRKEAGVGLVQAGALLFALGIVATGLMFGLQAAGSPSGLLDGEPPRAYFIFSAFPAFAAVLDLSVVARRGVAGAQRIARHLWRMCLALFIAAGSLFLGQPRVFPAPLRGSPILFAPEVAVLGLMTFWLLRVWFTGQFKPAVTDRLPPARPLRDHQPARGAA